MRCRGTALAAALVLSAVSVSALSDEPLPPGRAVRTFELDPGLVIELVAAEPVVRSPSAFAWDATGRLFVAENRGYPVGPAAGDPPEGAIVELIDTDADGRMDRRVVFAGGLHFPNGLTPWRDGWLVTDAPDLLWLRDTDGDGRADVREVWFTGFATNLTTQLRACYPTVGPDGWIYVSRGWSGGLITSPKWPHLPAVDLRDGDFRFRPDGTRAEAIGGNAQFGLFLDDLGRRFIVSNRNPLMHVVVHPRWWNRHPHLPFTGVVQDVAPPGADARVHPRSADTTTAGFIPDLLAAPHAGTFTAACGILQYDGSALGDDYRDHWFICEPAQNLIQRQVAKPVGATFTSRPATSDRDFLTSTDPWFRPVFLAAGPDGAIHIADMYRKVIDHPEYLPEHARRRLDFDAGKDHGRLWRVRRADSPPARGGERPRMDELGVDELVDALGDPDRWVRDTAHRLLLERGPEAGLLIAVTRALRAELPEPASDVRALSSLARRSDDPPGEAHRHRGTARRLFLLADILRRNLQDGTADESRDAVRVLMFATFSPSPLVREAAWRAWQSLPSDPWHALPDVPYELVLWWADEPNPATRLQFALVCGEQADWTPVVPALASIAHSDPGDRWLRTAVLSGLRGREREFLREFLARPVPDTPAVADFMDDLGALAGAAGDLHDFLGAMLEEGEAAEWKVAGAAGFARGMRSRNHALAPFLDRLRREADTEARKRAAHLGARLEKTALLALDPQAREGIRLRAIDLLAELPPDRAAGGLGTLLGPGHPAAIRGKALRALGRIDRPTSAEALARFARRSDISATERSVAVHALASRASFVPRLLDAVEAGDIPPWLIDSSRRRELRNHQDAEIRRRAGALLAEPGGGDRHRAYEELKPLLAERGDPHRGRDVFLKACAQCHTHGDAGVRVGPDLTGIRNQQPEVILFHIIVPDAEIQPSYTAYEIETRDGRSLTGLLVSENDRSVTLRLTGGTEETLAREQIDSLRASGVSLMPGGLEKGMSPVELRDLVAFLTAP